MRACAAAPRRRHRREWADVIDTLTIHLDTRRTVVRLLAEIDLAT
jgi:hypothetical protein